MNTPLSMPTGVITDNGAIIDNSQSPFEYSLKVVQADLPVDVIEGIESVPVTGDEYVLTVDRVQDQDGEQTPGTVQAAQAVTAASSCGHARRLQARLYTAFSTA